MNDQYYPEPSFGVYNFPATEQYIPSQPLVQCFTKAEPTSQLYELDSGQSGNWIKESPEKFSQRSPNIPCAPPQFSDATDSPCAPPQFSDATDSPQLHNLPCAPPQFNDAPDTDSPQLHNLVTRYNPPSPPQFSELSNLRQFHQPQTSVTLTYDNSPPNQPQPVFTNSPSQSSYNHPSPQPSQFQSTPPYQPPHYSPPPSPYTSSKLTSAINTLLDLGDMEQLTNLVWTLPPYSMSESEEVARAHVYVAFYTQNFIPLYTILQSRLFHPRHHSGRF